MYIIFMVSFFISLDRYFEYSENKKTKAGFSEKPSHVVKHSEDNIKEVLLCFL